MRSEVPSYIHTPSWLISIGLDSAAVDKPYAAVYSAPPRLNLMPQAPTAPSLSLRRHNVHSTSPLILQK
jgi:hypothetical protein